MIGVIAETIDHAVVAEFFELFKTPWEFYRSDSHYDVVLSTGARPVDGTAKLLIVYAGRRTPFDDSQAQPGVEAKQNCILSYRDRRLPIYGLTFTFSADEQCAVLRDNGSSGCAAYVLKTDQTKFARVGYDLFSEIRTLLSLGQPAANASMPALELHIAILRDLIISCDLSLIEIPPVPQGHAFVVCLTHDVDHPLIRRHQLDHTAAGFLLRAVFGSLADGFLGRMSIRNVLKSWLAAAKLPFVHLGLAKDFWSDFGERYMELEKGLPSTFFVIPKKNDPGMAPRQSGSKKDDPETVLRRPGSKDNPGMTVGQSAPEKDDSLNPVYGAASHRRASRYEARDLKDTIRKLRAGGCEVALHGIDAWCDEGKAREELQEVRSLSGASEIGVRMHWLYYDEKSPAVLEKANAAYDSTIGYNQTVGFWAGTTQVYKPLGADELLELPLHAMDTSLFYLSYLGLGPPQAAAKLRQVADCVSEHGGCLTVNWHDRSLAPERLWGGCYSDFIEELRSRGVWFATAGQAVSWFRKRRLARFEKNPSTADGAPMKVRVKQADKLPGLRLRVHRPGTAKQNNGNRAGDYVDLPVQNEILDADSQRGEEVNVVAGRVRQD